MFNLKTMRSTIFAATLLAFSKASAAVNVDVNNGKFSVKGDSVKDLLKEATPVRKDGRKLEDVYYNADGHIARYSIQFSGCHHIQQWNDDGNYYDDVRIQTKRLVRFRLVPYEQCTEVPAWATYFQKARNVIGQFEDYGEYIVDMNTFVYSYLIAAQESGSSDCNDYTDACEDMCNNGDDDNVDDKYDTCMEECYSFYSCSFDDDAAADDGAAAGLDAMDYYNCAAVDFQGDDDGGAEYYVGPYCADHGNEIRFSLFTDDTCTNMARCNGGMNRGGSCYTAATGTALPFSSASLIQDPCVPCSENFLTMAQMDADDIDENFEFGYPRELCSNVYGAAGKCEEHLSSGSGDTSGCTYIQGVRVGVNDDGVVMGVERSRDADIAMGSLVIATTFIGMYIYYLQYTIRHT